MSAKTMFCFGLIVALAAVGPAVALPLSTGDESGIENGKIVMAPAKETAIVTESSQQPSSDETRDLAAAGTDPSVQTESNTATSTAQPTENAAGSTSPAAESSATGSDGPEPTATGSESQEPTAEQGSPQHGQIHRPKPNYESVKVAPTYPFYLEFFQPFQPFQPVPQSGAGQQPVRRQPFGTVIDPFDPFASPMGSPPPFNQLVEAYTNEFRTPEVIIVKPKRTIQLNTTAMPPIPLLMNIMLNAFRHEPPEMLESFEQSIPKLQFNDNDNAQSGSNKPVSKTTTKTEIIDGHVVQINETTYSNGDENHKSYYHFKEIQVLPEQNTKKIANEKVMTMIKDDTDSEKVELNEIKRDPIDTFGNTPAAVNQPNIEKKSVSTTAASGRPLDEYYQTAAASYYGSPYAPSYYRPKPVHGQSPPPPPPPPTYWNGQQHVQPHVHPGYNNGGRPPHVHPGYNNGGQPHFQPAGYGGQHVVQPGQHGHFNGQQHHQQPAGQHQTAAAPGIPYGGPVAISLAGDTLVNDLMAARQKASGAQFQLPADVVLVDVNELPRQGPRRTRLSEARYVSL